MSELYRYLDQKGIPLYKFNVQFTLSSESKHHSNLDEFQLLIDEALGNTYQSGDLIIRVNNEPKSKWHTDFPSKFSKGQEIDDLLALSYLTETTGLKFEDLSCIPERPLLNGNPFLIMLESEGRYHAKFAEGELTGNLVIREKFHEKGYLQFNFINTFGKIKKITGNVGIDCKIKDFGELEEVDGNLWFSTHIAQDQLESISPLKKVTGDININHTIISLKSLAFVGGNLNLRKSKVQDISSLQFVGGNVLVSKIQQNHLDFSHVKIVGKVKYFNDDFII